MKALREFKTKNGIFVAGDSDVLGKGTYGVVYRVRKKDDPSVQKAIKSFSPNMSDENEGIPSTTLREINALKMLNHPNLLSLEEVVVPPNGFKDMFVVMELCQGTLRDKISTMIKTHLKHPGDPRWLYPTSATKLPAAYLRECKLVVWQILNALTTCHSRAVMHRDLKPANIMWGFDDLLKIGDFGLTRFVRGGHAAENTVLPQTGEVQTLWYRAPEVLLGDEKYGLLVDDWSVGCVMAEFFRFRLGSSSGRLEPCPLFQGRGDIHTLMLVFEALGTPDDAYLRKLPYWSEEYPKWKQGVLRDKVPLLDDLGFELLTSLLQPSPSDRAAARFLLDHEWFNDVRATIEKLYVPWHRGFEDEYRRLYEAAQYPPAQPLETVNRPRSRAKPPMEEKKAPKQKSQPVKKTLEPKRPSRADRSRSPNRAAPPKKRVLVPADSENQMPPNEDRKVGPKAAAHSKTSTRVVPPRTVAARATRK